MAVLKKEFINRIELKDRNRIKEFIHNLYNRLEDLLFTIISKLPESSSHLQWYNGLIDT
ncbi:MAG: hypothetical protein HDR16_03585 [Lachnospiraceae bacterium]|nr:hypothetical protein [Lachnospiraceae bacterium]